jgi:hypothetical protein
VGFLDYQRATLEWKCRGLSDEQLRVALPPTSMTLGGMLKHLARIEDYWFTEVAAREPAPEPWAGSDDDWEMGQRSRGYWRRPACPVGGTRRALPRGRAGTTQPAAACARAAPAGWLRITRYVRGIYAGQGP